jgi:hypothetical protein
MQPTLYAEPHWDLRKSKLEHGASRPGRFLACSATANDRKEPAPRILVYDTHADPSFAAAHSGEGMLALARPAFIFVAAHVLFFAVVLLLATDNRHSATDGVSVRLSGDASGATIAGTSRGRPH